MYIVNILEADVRKSAEEMDEQRQKTTAYEYLCHLEETKVWMEACLREQLPPTTELEENLRNGVYLAKLANFMDPNAVQLKKIYDIEQKRYKIAGLQFRHTDNINLFIQCMKSIQLPLVSIQLLFSKHKERKKFNTISFHIPDFSTRNN